MSFRPLAEVVLISALLLGAALGAERYVRRIGVPAPPIFLLAGIGLGSVWATAGLAVTPERLTIIGTLALIVILLQGGLDCGLAALRRELAPVIGLGIFGTAATFGLVAVAAHVLIGFSWTPALILGAVLSPTDPAAVFSVVGAWRQGGGRVIRVLEGEAGFNDPVAIALVIALVDGVTDGNISPLRILGHIAIEGAVGAVIGLAAGGAAARAPFPMLRRLGLDVREATFATLAGLKGAVPILLAAIPLVAGINDAPRIFGIVGIAVLASLAVQGATVARVAPRLLG